MARSLDEIKNIKSVRHASKNLVPGETAKSMTKNIPSDFLDSSNFPVHHETAFQVNRNDRTARLRWRSFIRHKGAANEWKQYESEPYLGRYPTRRN